MIFIFCSFWHCFISSLYPKCILKTLAHVFSLKVEIVHYAVKQRQCREPVLPGWTNTFSTILTMDTWLSQKTRLCCVPEWCSHVPGPCVNTRVQMGRFDCWEPQRAQCEWQSLSTQLPGGFTGTPAVTPAVARPGTGRADGAQEHR